MDENFENENISFYEFEYWREKKENSSQKLKYRHISTKFSISLRSKTSLIIRPWNSTDVFSSPSVLRIFFIFCWNVIVLLLWLLKCPIWILRDVVQCFFIRMCVFRDKMRDAKCLICTNGIFRAELFIFAFIIFSIFVNGRWRRQNTKKRTKTTRKKKNVEPLKKDRERRFLEVVQCLCRSGNVSSLLNNYTGWIIILFFLFVCFQSWLYCIRHLFIHKFGEVKFSKGRR